MKETIVLGNNIMGQVQRTELFRTSQSWDGVELPDYLQGRPELVAVKLEFPAGQRLDYHYHPVINFGLLTEGELTIIAQDGREKTLHAGETLVEMVDTVHYGENRGTKPAVLYMFYLSQKDLPLSVLQQEEQRHAGNTHG
jgi:quercetin dioxygenase-like cupin family protein